MTSLADIATISQRETARRKPGEDVSAELRVPALYGMFLRARPVFPVSCHILPRPMLRAGIVGLPNVGKSTLFNALTRTRKAEAANYPFCTIEPNVGVVTVP